MYITTIHIIQQVFTKSDNYLLKQKHFKGFKLREACKIIPHGSGVSEKVGTYRASVRRWENEISKANKDLLPVL